MMIQFYTLNMSNERICLMQTHQNKILISFNAQSKSILSLVTQIKRIKNSQMIMMMRD